MAARKKAAPPNTVEIPADLHDRWLKARENKGQWAEIEGDARKEIETLMGDNEIAMTPDGVPVISWKHGKAARLVQSKIPDEIKRQYTELQPTRTFKEI